VHDAPMYYATFYLR